MKIIGLILLYLPIVFPLTIIIATIVGAITKLNIKVESDKSLLRVVTRGLFLLLSFTYVGVIILGKLYE